MEMIWGLLTPLVAFVAYFLGARSWRKCENYDQQARERSIVWFSENHQSFIYAYMKVSDKAALTLYQHVLNQEESPYSNSPHYVFTPLAARKLDELHSNQLVKLNKEGSN